MIKPLQDRVVIEAQDYLNQTEGGIIIPDTAKEKLPQGIIVAIGPGKKDEPMIVKVGDKVMFNKHAGTEINIKGKDYLIMRETDLFAIL